MKYLAEKSADGSVDVSLRLSASEVEAIREGGLNVELYEAAHPEDGILGVTFGRHACYAVRDAAGHSRTIHAYGDLHAFAVAMADASSDALSIEPYRAPAPSEVRLAA